MVAERGTQILFSQADAGIVWADPALDITADVIKRFDAAAPAQHDAARHDRHPDAGAARDGDAREAGARRHRPPKPAPAKPPAR